MSKQVELRLTFFIDLPDEVTTIDVDEFIQSDISYGQHGTTYGTFMSVIEREVTVDGVDLDEYNERVAGHGDNCGNCGRDLNKHNRVEVEGRGNYCESCAKRYQEKS